MKVLHVYRTYYPDPPGGLQQAIQQICAGCQPLGVESAVFTLSPSPLPASLSRAEGMVHRSRSYWAPASCDLGGPEAFRHFDQLARWADVLHFHFPWPFADLLNLMPAARRPKVMTYHSDIVKQRVLGRLYYPLMRHTLGSMDAVVATSPAYAQTSPVLRQLVSAEQLKVIPLGMNDALPLAAVDSGAESIVARLGLTDQPFILSLGVLRYYKGLHVLVEAASHTRGTIVLAGSGPEDQNLRQQVARLGLDNVVFAGQVSEAEKHELLSRCTALALPSHLRSEAYGMVLLEAAMHSKPQISCDIGTGTSFINQHLETGFVVPPEDPESLAAAMNRLIADDIEAQAMGHRARQRYEQHFTGAIMARSYAALYQSVTSH